MINRRFLISAFAFLLVAVPSFGQQKMSDQAFIKMTDDVTKALIANDVATLNRTLTDDFVKTAASAGRGQSKEQWVGGIRDGKQHYLSFDFTNEKVGVYDGTAIVSAVMHFRVVNGDRPAADNYEVLNAVWVQQGGTWKLAEWISWKDPNAPQNAAPAAAK